MTARELFEWAAFERVFGPITVQERVDAAGAVSAWGSLVAMGNRNVKPEDVLADWARASEQRQQTPEQIMAALRGLQRRRKGV